MQVLQGRSTRSDLPMSNAARKQLGIQLEVIRNIDKHEVLPTHDIHVGQSVMHQDSVTKQWHQAVITRLCQEKRSYMINTSDGVVYRNMQAHLKPYTQQNKKSEAVQCVSQPMAQSDHMWPVKNWWHNLITRSLHKWKSITSTYKQTKKGHLSPSQAWFISTLMFT